MHQRTTNPQPGESMAFLKSLSGAITLLVFSAGILLTGYLHYLPRTAFAANQDPQTSAKPITIGADHFKLLLGQGEYANQTLTLQQLTEADKRAVISAGRTSLDADSYPFLQYTINNLNPGLDLLFFWRTRDDSRKISTAKLYWSGDGPAYYNLTKEAEWKGHIIEIGLLVYGDLRNQPLELVGLGLHPYSAKTLLSTIWSEWTAFEGWSQRSINFLAGTAPKSILSPTVATAAWTGLAIFIYVVGCLVAAIKIRKRPTIGIIVPTAILLIGWMALDFKWQIELFRQLGDTKYLYAGKTTEEKHLAAEDGDLYNYTQRLTDEVLPKEPARVFILHESSGHNYWRLRAQYHLLPHSIYNYGRYPDNHHLKDGDWILVLGAIDTLAFDLESNTLVWNDGQRLHVKLMDKDPLGTLLLFNRTKLTGQCNADKPTIINATVENDGNFHCVTDKPILISNFIGEADASVSLRSKQITISQTTHLKEGINFTATALKDCTAGSCRDMLEAPQPNTDDE
jgi:hypothetical protein